MATIGSITVAFRANLKELEDGIEDAIDLFDSLIETVDDVSEKLEDASESTVKIRTAVDTSAVTAAAKKVKRESEEIEKASPKLKVNVSGDFLGGFTQSVVSQTEEIASGFTSLGASAGSAVRSIGSAAQAVGAVFDGTAASVDGVIKAVGRARDAYGEYADVVDAATSTTAGLVSAAGGLGSVFAAMAGSVAATAKVGGALVGTLAGVATGLVTYAAVMGATRVATAGLSEESRAYVESAARWVAVTASAASSAAVLGSVSKEVALAIWSSQSASDALSKSLALVGGAASTASRSLIANLSAVATVFAAVNVASGRFSRAIEQMGSQAESTRNMSERFGSTVEQMQVLGFAADAAGVSMGQLAKAQQAFYTSVGKIKIGQLNTESTKEAKIAFDKLGISIEDLRNRSPQEVFSLVGDRLNEVSDASERTAIAFDLFGKQGGNILPALRGLKDAAEDAARLGTVISTPTFRMFEGADQSFDRLNEASKNLSQTMMIAFVPLQTGLNNMMADIKGGLASALEPIRTVFAAATVPLQVMMEVAGRLINIFLRLVGAVGKFVAATTNAVAIAAAWSALGDVIKAILVPLESAVSAVETVASAFASAFAPAIESSASVVDKLVFAVKTFASTIVAAGVASAIMQSFGIQAGVAFATFAKGLLSVNLLSWASAVGAALKGVVVGLTSTAVAAVKNFTLMGVSAIANFVTPVVGGIATFIASLTGLSAASMVTGISMAAAWAIGTAGLTLLIAAGIAVYQNFDKLSDFFSDFGDNVANLFTFEGATEAASAAAGAIMEAFMSILSGIGGFVGKIIKSIIGAFTKIKPPPAIDAARSSADEIVKQRQRVADSQFDQQKAVQVQFNAMGMGGAVPEPVPPPTEDYDAMASAITKGREELATLSYEAAAFGATSKDAVLEAQNQFNKLLDQLSKGEIDAKQFEDGAKKIQKSLRENIDLADVISPEEKQKFLESLQDASKQAGKAVREVSAGTVVEGQFFPASDAIKSQAAAFKDEYDKQLKDIAKKASEGGFGEGEQGKQNMASAQEDAAREFQRNMDRVARDTSFADEIRKNLTTAFLDPVGLYEKRLKEISENASLSPEEKKQAIAAEQKGFVEANFGKTQGDSIRERRASLERAMRPDENGTTAIDSVRAGVESRRLASDQRQAAGLEDSPAQQLQLGVDKVNDAFGVAGKTMDEIQSTLSPAEFKEYQDAIKKNSDAVRANLGVEKTGAQQISESREKLAQAVKDNVITEDEKNKALKEQRDSLLSSLGISKSPTQDFEDAVERIKENAAELSPEETAKGLKEAKDKLLSALGIDKAPSDEFADRMKDLNEAAQKGRISQEELAKGAQKAKDSLLQSLGIPLDPVVQLGQRLKDLDAAFASGAIDDKELARGQEEARRSMLPGGEEESPVKKFERDIEAVGRAVEGGLISEEDGAARKKNLQAQLQEDLAPALDATKQDRRGVEGADARSKAGVDTFFRILRGNDNPSLKAQLEIARNTKVLAEASRNPDAAPVIAQLSAR